MSEHLNTLEKLRATPLFADFTHEELANFVGLAETVRVKSGETIVRQDDRGDAMFVIVEGGAKVSHHADDRRIELAVLGPGDFFGEIALVDHGPRSADVVAVGDSTLLRLDAGAVRAVAGVYPGAAFKFLVAVGRVLVERVRRANKKYIDSLLIGAPPM